MSKGMQATPWYYGSVYFFLHFQYNGAFLFCLFGMLFKILELSGVDISWANKSLPLLVPGVIMGFALTLLGFEISTWILVIAVGGAVFSFMGMIMLAQKFVMQRNSILSAFSPGIARVFAILSFFSFILKTFLQSVSVFPFLSSWVFSDRNLVIAWLHLVLIGMVTLGLFSIMISRNWGISKANPINQWGYLFIACFFGTEVLLVISPGQLIYKELIFLFSAAMLVIVAAWLFASFWEDKNDKQIET